MSYSSSGGVNNLSSFLNNPQLLSALYPNLNLSAYANLYQAESAALEQPVQNLSSEVSSLTSQSSAWSQLEQSAQQVLGDISTLSGTAAWQTPSVTSSNTSGVGAAVTSGGTPVSGTYTVAVSSTAAAYDLYQSQVEASATSALGLSGSFSLNGQSITVGSTDSLDTIAQSINSANAGVSAAVMTTTSTSGATSYYLTVTSDKYANITVSDPNAIFKGTGTSGLGEVEQHAATEWSYTVNGLQTYSDTNTDSTTIPGVTLTISQASANATVTVTNTDSQATSALQSLVTDYNSLQSTVQSLTGQGQPLAGNVLAEDILNQVNSYLLQSESSQPVGYQNLSSLGLTLSFDKTTNTAKLNFDSSTFNTQYSANQTAAQNLFTEAGGPVGALNSYLTNLTSTTGEIQSAQQGISSQIASLTQSEQTEQGLVQMQQQALANLFNQEIQSLLAVQQQESTISSLINQLSSQSGNGSGSSGTASGG
jgi:flagellar hook-associated protein 2